MGIPGFEHSGQRGAVWLALRQLNLTVHPAPLNRAGQGIPAQSLNLDWRHSVTNTQEAVQRAGLAPWLGHSSG